MHHIRTLAGALGLTVTALALTTVPAAAAPSRSVRVATTSGAAERVVPSGQSSDLLDDYLARRLKTSDPQPACLRLAGGSVLVPGDNANCSAPRGTKIMVLPLWNECSSVEPPFSADPAIQRQCAAEVNHQEVISEQVTVDGGHAVEMRTPRFETYTRQRHVRLPEDNLLGVDPQSISFTGHAWVGIVRGLSIGRHTIHIDAVFDFGPPDGPQHFISDLSLTILARGQH